MDYTHWKVVGYGLVQKQFDTKEEMPAIGETVTVEGEPVKVVGYRFNPCERVWYCNAEASKDLCTLLNLLFLNRYGHLMKAKITATP
jgi:hypothetical protein